MVPDTPKSPGTEENGATAGRDECCSDKSDFVIIKPPEYRSVEGLKV